MVRRLRRYKKYENLLNIFKRIWNEDFEKGLRCYLRLTAKVIITQPMKYKSDVKYNSIYPSPETSKNNYEKCKRTNEKRFPGQDGSTESKMIQEG